MSKKKHHKQPGRQPLPPSGAGPQSKEELFEWFAAHRIHAVVRVEDGKERLSVGSFDQSNPLPRGFYLVARRYEKDLIDLVKRSDVKVCIDPTNPTHRDSIHADEQGRFSCHACATYREVSEKMRERHKEEEIQTEVKPYLYTLPDDLQTVQLLAVTAALDTAVTAYTTGQRLNATMGIPALALHLASGHEQLEVDGKRGTNDPMKFREVFIVAISRVYPVMFALLEKTPEFARSLQACDANERWQRLMNYASQQPDLLNIPDNRPISFVNVEML